MAQGWATTGKGRGATGTDRRREQVTHPGWQDEVVPGCWARCWVETVHATVRRLGKTSIALGGSGELPQRGRRREIVQCSHYRRLL